MFANGGKLAQFGFAVTGERKKDEATGQWTDKPCFLDMKAWNRQQGRKWADFVEQYLRKGQEIYLEGHLTLEQWTAQDGGKRQKLVVVVDDIVFVGKKDDNQPRPATSATPTQSTTPGNQPSNYERPPWETDQATCAPPSDDGSQIHF